MQQRKIVCIVLMLCATWKVKAQNSYDDRVRRYIEQYADWAIAEQKRSGVPAAITLAQGIHETSAGGSELALNANNHFGIKCRKEWQGPTYAYTDDAPNECFRKYPSALQSYKDHSDYLAGSRRYESLFRLSVNDYKGWAAGLKRCGYATNPKYAHLIIKLVEEYDLQKYTYAALKEDYNPVRDAAQPGKATASVEVVPDKDIPAPATVSKIATSRSASRKSSMSVSYEAQQPAKEPAMTEAVTEPSEKPEYGKLVKVNGVKAFYAKKGTVLLDDAFRFNIRYAKLLELNELADLPLEADMYIFLEKKNPKGIHQTHTVKEGETLAQIAQAQGMQLRYLKYYNRIGSNEEPVPGAVLQLQQYAEVKPQTYVKTVAPREESLAFAGSNPGAVPQGATRKRASYISKKEIKAAETTEEVATAHQEYHQEVASPASEMRSEPAVAHVEPEVQAPAVEVKDAPETASASSLATIIDGQPTETTKVGFASAVQQVAEPAIPAEQKTEAIKEEPVVEPAQSVAAVSAAPEPPVEIVKEETASPAATNESVTALSAPSPIAQEIPVNETTTTAATSLVKEPAAKEAEKSTAKARVKEEIEYDVVQPEPVIVKKGELKAATPAEEVKVRQPETISSVAPAGKDIKPAPVEKVVVAAPGKVELPPIAEEPKDEFDRLKARLDRVVYAGGPSVVVPRPEEKKQEAKAQPAKTVKEETKKEPVVAAAAEPGKMYTVKKGDTAFSIAKKYNITMRQLMDWNKLDFERVKEGQKLRVKP